MEISSSHLPSFLLLPNLNTHGTVGSGVGFPQCCAVTWLCHCFPRVVPRGVVGLCPLTHCGHSKTFGNTPKKGGFPAAGVIIL